MPDITALTSDRQEASDIEFERDEFALTRDLTTGVLQLVTRSFDKAAHAELESRLGMSLPDEPNRVSRSGTTSVAWIAPGQWYALLPEVDAVALNERWSAAIADTTALCLNMSDQLSVLQLRGTAASELLSSLVPIDIELWARNETRCLRTALTNFTVFIERLETDESFRLIVDQSYREIACALLVDAAKNRLLR